MRTLLTLTVVLVLILASDTGVRGQPKKGKDQVTVLDTSAADYSALAKYPGVTGKITSMAPNGKAMTLRIEYQVPDLTPDKPKQPNPVKQPTPPNKNPAQNIYNQQKLMNELEQIQRIKNPAQQQQRLMQFMNKLQSQQLKQQVAQMNWVQKQFQQMAKQQQPGQPANVKFVTYAKEFQLAIVPGARIAKKLLGLEYDEKGNIKEYTPDQLKKMQDDKLPGYKAKIEEVTPGLTVYVYLTKLDTTPKAEPKDKVDAKDKDAKDKDGKDKENPDAKAKPGVQAGDIISGSVPPDTAMNGPVVQAILILSEPGFNNLPPDKKKKN